MTWLGIVVAGILLLTAYKGFRRGFIREIVSFFFVFLALAVSWAINPYVNEFFMENTPVYEKIQESCQSFVESQKKQELTSPGTEEQTGFIEGLELPELLQKGLESSCSRFIWGIHFRSPGKDDCKWTVLFCFLSAGLGDPASWHLGIKSSCRTACAEKCKQTGRRTCRSG